MKRYLKEINFRRCKFCYISHRLKFSGGETLLTFCGLFTVARYVMIMPSMITAFSNKDILTESV